ncbi:MAG TPA: response regulator transcription factor [Capillimicrobium sp.]|nr:response regulator transcription factor [Capillimicrobium sp.]
MNADPQSPAAEETEMRVLVADDDPLVRSAVRDALSERAGIRIDGEAVNGEEAVALALRRRPDVVLLDVGIPRVDAVTVTRRIRSSAPGVEVVVFSSSPDDEVGLLGLRAGAAGFLLKDVSSDALARALRGIQRGEAAVSRRLTRQVLESLRRAPDAGAGMRPVWSPLTSREWQVLDLLCEGASTEAIAERLVLAVETVRTHIKHVLAKLGAHSREEAIAVARQLRSGGGSTQPCDSVDEVGQRRVANRLREHGHS